MVQYYRPLQAEIASPTLASAASTVSDTTLVRAVNSSTTAYEVFLISATLDDSATMTLTGGETVLIPKESTTKMYAANAAIKLTAVTHPRGQDCAMKLISEFVDHQIGYNVITEEKSGKKKYVIEGVFAQAEQKNRNGRIYPKPIMEKAVNAYSEKQVYKGRAVGELNHPEGPTVNLDKVSHKIDELKFEGNDVMGKATVLNTPMGEIVKGLLDGGVQLGVSTRGMGSLMQQNNAMVVKDDFMLNAIDIVQDPSAPSAFVNGVMEGVDWVWDNGILSAQAIEKMETEIKKAPRADLYEVQVREFKNFLSLLKN